ncbi:aspartate/glutamate racemase family protein [uncultured Litoreibacter sp.]|uniref:maleate cis-trans isomerase family protein n=1 Tax=uncultured Litoreibacter sp. TaxID=1392394 RepID=UPI002604760B|nr:aspartate/glutamate racemase family protein [uncultured Litoreibacter sp.]
MTAFRYDLEELHKKTLGLIVLQSDETIEQDFRRILPLDINLHISRVPSGLEVTSDSLQQMEQHLPDAAGLFPRGLHFDAVGYGCTSGTAQIGPERISSLVQGGVSTGAVSQPVSALIAACKHLGLSRLAILSPYIEEVSNRLRQVLAEHGIDTPVFGSFEEAEEQKVVRIDAASVQEAAFNLAAQGGIDGVFLSCTNLRTFDVIGPLESDLDLPVLSSNQVLAWHLTRLAGAPLHVSGFGRLLA